MPFVSRFERLVNRNPMRCPSIPHQVGVLVRLLEAADSPAVERAVEQLRLSFENVQRSGGDALEADRRANQVLERMKQLLQEKK